MTVCSSSLTSNLPSLTLPPGKPRPIITAKPTRQATTFQDILPPALITSPSSSIEARAHSVSPTHITFGSLSARLSPTHTDRHTPSPRSQFVDAVRRTALPKMHDVVQNLRRSVTTVNRSRGAPVPRARAADDTAALLRRTSQASSMSLARSASVSSVGTARSSVSRNKRLSVPPRL